MILGFKQFFPWHTEKTPDPTYFREKILSNGDSFLIRKILSHETDRIQPGMILRGVYSPETHLFTRWDGGIQDLKDFAPYSICEATKLYTKLHTIREGNRWKADDLIHMAYGVRTKNYHQFNKDIPELQRVKSVQQIEIKYGKDFGVFQGVIVAVDRRILNERECLVLAINDGFESLNQFYRWFNKDFTGQIIHWTDLRY